MIIRKSLILILLTIISCGYIRAEDTDSTHSEEFNISETLFHHILDSHDWHLVDIPTGETDAHGDPVYKPVALHLPWLFYSSKTGLEFYANTHAMHEAGKYVSHHEHVYAVAEGQSVPHEYHGHGELENSEEIIDESVAIYDLSPSKTVVQIFLIGLLLVWLLSSVAKSYAKREGQAPKGMQSLMEPIILFVRDDIAKEYLGEKAEKFAPYLLSLFFFIWFSNMFGLMPFNSNIMGNISVTAALALLSFILIQVNGSKDYWRHTFAMPGVPIAIVPLMTIIEVLSLFIKPIALAIRLFANITAGHFMVLSMVCLIFLMGESGKNLGGAFGIMPVSIVFTLAILTLEVIVAIIQAYIFTLLTAVFIGMARETHDDHH